MRDQKFLDMRSKISALYPQKSHTFDLVSLVLAETPFQSLHVVYSRKMKYKWIRWRVLKLKELRRLHVWVYYPGIKSDDLKHVSHYSLNSTYSTSLTYTLQQSRDASAFAWKVVVCSYIRIPSASDLLCREKKCMIRHYGNCTLDSLKDCF